MGAVSSAYLVRNAVALATGIDVSNETDGAAPGGATTHRVLSVRLARSQEGAGVPAAMRVAGSVEPVSADGGKARRKLRMHGPSAGSPAAGHDKATDGAPPSSEMVSTYRTVCVRECDGAYFPISFSTTRQHFARDASACTSRCGSPARLFVYPVGGGSPETMVDLDGKPYSSLANANVFRSQRRPSCTCRPEAWQQEASNRHRVFELAALEQKQPWQARELALRAAIEEVRQLRPGGLPALTSGVEMGAPRPRRDLMPGDGLPIVGGREPASGEQPDPAVRYAGALKATSVVYDATGRPVMLKPAPPGAAPPVTVIARVAEVPDGAAALATASISAEPRQAAAGQLAAGLQGGTAHRETVNGDGDLEDKPRGVAASLPAASAKQQAANRRKSELRTAAKKPRLDRGNLTASADSWYGRRLYNGSDWRLNSFQLLE